MTRYKDGKVQGILHTELIWSKDDSVQGALNKETARYRGSSAMRFATLGHKPDTG